MKLLVQAIAKTVLGVLCMGAVLFLPAGTFHYPGAWLIMAILFIPMVFVGIYLYCKAPELLKKRLNSNEQNGQQKLVILFSGMLFVGTFVLAGLDFRFGWSYLPQWGEALAAVLLLVGYGLYVEVMRENAYLSRTVEVQQGQKVIDTGLYGVVRHPLYFATILVFLTMPLMLGSLVAFLVAATGYLPVLVLRITDEERTLAVGLPGYREYMDTVKYRMLPFIW